MDITPQKFVEDWERAELKERASAQSHFESVCRMLGHKLPHELDPKGEFFAYEYGVQKSGGGQGFADVFYKGHFAIEYKGKGKYTDLNAAYQQLLRYRENLFNPPLLIVCDIETWEVHTNFPNTEKKIYKFTNREITQNRIQKLLHNLFHNPEALHPDRNTEEVTTDAAKVFQRIADNMRGWQADPERIAHFLTKLVFCLFAEDVTLLPNFPNSGKGIFSELVERTRTNPAQFKEYTSQLFRAMADGGNVLLQPIPYFNGKLFEDVAVEDLSLEALTQLAQAARLNWSSVEPAIFGTLFERSLDPSKRAQLGAHYTSRDDILLIVEPVLMQPLHREWEAIKAEAAALRAEYDAAETPRVKINRQNELLALREKMLNRLRTIKVLDPACGSGNFLYVSLNLLLDMEKSVINDPLFYGFPQPFPEVHPRQLYGMELDPIAHALASIVVWIGYIQWRQNNGYLTFREPILEALGDNIRRMDAILNIPTPNPSPQSREGNLNRAAELPSPFDGEGQGEGTKPAPSLDTAQGEGTKPAASVDPIPTYTSAALYEKLKPLARQMRTNPTPAEDALWQRLRKRQVGDYKFRRQHHIDRFIVDFYCPEARLIIEVDGEVHEYTQAEDALRQEYLESLGLRVLRFKNHEIFQQMRGVLEVIGEALQTIPTPAVIPTPNPSPQSREGNLNRAAELPSPFDGEGQREGTKPAPSLDPAQGAETPTPPQPTEPIWETVDVIVGNPPFLGGNRIRAELGDTYVENLFKLYAGRVPAFADLVTYWFEKARAQVASGKAKRVGLLSTNSIRGGANREVLKRIKDSGDIFMAWSDREWILDGAAVRVSMVGFDDATEQNKSLDGQPVTVINPDLTASVDITKAKPLTENFNIQFEGTKKGADFDISFEVAQKMLKAVNSSSRLNSDVIHPWANGSDVVQRPRQMWIIDFGTSMTLEEAMLYEAPFNYVMQHIKPKYEKSRSRWWLHERTRPDMRLALAPLERYILTPRVAKHRIFIWQSKIVLPDSATIAIARDDDYFFGVLHSKIHEVWSLRMGTSLEDRPRYTPTTTFETFPFPWSPGKEPVVSSAAPESAQPAPASPAGRVGEGLLYDAIAAAAKELHEKRDAWLNGKTEVKDRTLTNLYNALNVIRGVEKLKPKPVTGEFVYQLDELHQALDRAVCAAYGWETDILNDEEAILSRLLALNLQRSQG